MLAHGVDDLHRRLPPHLHHGVDINRQERCKNTPRWEALAPSKGDGHAALKRERLVRRRPDNQEVAFSTERARLWSRQGRRVHFDSDNLRKFQKAIISTKILATCCQSKNLISRNTRPINAEAHKLRTWRSTHSETGKATQRTSPILNAPLMREVRNLRFCSWVRSSLRGAEAS